MPGHHRPEVLLDLGQPGDAHRAVAPSVEAAPERNDLVIAAVFSGHPERGVHGFRSRRHEDDLVEVGGGLLDELPRQGQPLRGREVEGVEEALGLLPDGRGQPRVSMTDVGHEHPGRPVEIVLAVDVPDLGAPAMVPDDRRLPVHAGRLVELGDLEPVRRLEFGFGRHRISFISSSPREPGLSGSGGPSRRPRWPSCPIARSRWPRSRRRWR